MDMTPTASSLTRPGADPGYVTGAQRARDLVMRASAPSTAAQGGQVMSQAQQGQVASAAQGAAQQDVIQKASQEVAAAKGQAQQGMTDLGNQANNALAAGNLANQQLKLKQADLLNTLDTSAKAQLYDKQMKFQTDELGRKVLTDSQLQDWAVTQAKSQEDLKNKAQQIEQASARSIQMLQVGYRKLAQELQDAEQGKIQGLSQQNKLQIAQAMSQMKAEMAEKQAKARSRQAMWTGLGTVAGAIAGFVIPGVGPAAGAVVGGGVGSAVAGANPDM